MSNGGVPEQRVRGSDITEFLQGEVARSRGKLSTGVVTIDFHPHLIFIELHSAGQEVIVY